MDDAYEQAITAVTATVDTLLTADAANLTGVLSRITVEELIELTIELASKAAVARTEYSAASIHRQVMAAHQAELLAISPPSDWYITKSTLWKQNPSNPGRPTVLARRLVTGALVVYSPEVWRFLQRVVPLPPAITELRKLHGDDVPTGSLPLPTTPGHKP